MLTIVFSLKFQDCLRKDTGTQKVSHPGGQFGSNFLSHLIRMHTANGVSDCGRSQLGPCSFWLLWGALAQAIPETEI